MSEWALRRFWKEAKVSDLGEGYTVLLDGRQVKTPAKALLRLPSAAMARAVASEWNAQTDTVNPAQMPFTRSANAAIDKVTPQHAEVAEMLAAYGDSDLLCYRAEHPEELVRRQAAAWDPPLAWAETTLGARLEPRIGVIHAAQDSAALDRLRGRVRALDAYRLAAFHDLVTLTGSLILGFAAALNWRDAQAVWSLSRLDEDWQIEQWGADDEATAAADVKRRAFLHAKTFFDCA